MMVLFVYTDYTDVNNTYEEIKDKSRLSNSLKISLYRLVSDFGCNFFTSEMTKGGS